MKKIIAMVLMTLFVFAVLSLNGCGGQSNNNSPDQEAFDTYCEANRYASIFKRHNNILESVTYYFNDEEVYTESFYLDNDQLHCVGSEGVEALFRNDLSLYVYTDGTMPDRTMALYEDKEDCGKYFNEYRSKGLLVLAESEILVETIDKDGFCTLVSEDNSKEGVLNIIDYVNLPQQYGTYEEGMKAQYRHIIDKKSTDLLRIEGYVIDSKGKSSLVLIYENKYDVEPYDPATASKSYKEYFDNLENGDVCNLTLVYAPGTDKEHSVIYKVPYGTAFYTFVDRQYVERFYLDKECTKEYEGNDQRPELTLYVK